MGSPEGVYKAGRRPLRWEGRILRDSWGEPPVNPPRSRDKDVKELADIVEEAQLVAPAAIDRALRRAHDSGRPLWRVLLREGALCEDAMFEALGAQLRVPVLTDDQLVSVIVPDELKEAVSYELAQRLGVLPLERSTDGRRAALAMVDPTLDITPLWPALTPLGVVEVRRFLMSLGTLRLGLDQFYGRGFIPDSPSIVPEPPEPEPEDPTLPPQRSPFAPPESGPSVMVDPQLQVEIAKLSSELPSAPVPMPIELRTTQPLAVRVPTPSRLAAVQPNSPSVHLGEEPTASQVSADMRMPRSPAVSRPPVPTVPTLPSLHSERTGPREVAPGKSLPPAPPRAASPPTASPPTASPPTASPRASTPPRGTPLGKSLPPAPPRAAMTSTPPRAAMTPTPPRAAMTPTPMPVPPVSKASQLSPVPELAPADVLLDEVGGAVHLTRDPDELRVPTGVDGPGIGGPTEDELLQDALILSCEALCAQSEAQTRSSWPGILARLCQAAADRMGLVPRAVREVMLVARLFGLQRVLLLSGDREPSSLPLELTTQVGFLGDVPLGAPLRELQAVLVEFMSLPADDGAPLGVRIVRAAAQALVLWADGTSEEALLSRLLAGGADRETAEAVSRALRQDPPPREELRLPVEDREPPREPAHASRLSLSQSAAHAPPPVLRPLWPLPPRMPEVPWTTRVVPTLSAEDLVPHRPEELGS
jgi:hypothetical protein